MHSGLAAQRAWDLLLLRAPTAALAAAADHHTVAGWIALAATPAGCPLPATLLQAVPAPGRRGSSTKVRCAG